MAVDVKKLDLRIGDVVEIDGRRYDVVPRQTRRRRARGTEIAATTLSQGCSNQLSATTSIARRLFHSVTRCQRRARTSSAGA
jgi:hypothetical protein